MPMDLQQTDQKMLSDDIYRESQMPRNVYTHTPDMLFHQSISILVALALMWIHHIANCQANIDRYIDNRMKFQIL